MGSGVSGLSVPCLVWRISDTQHSVFTLGNGSLTLVELGRLRLSFCFFAVFGGHLFAHSGGSEK